MKCNTPLNSVALITRYLFILDGDILQKITKSSFYVRSDGGNFVSENPNQE